MIGRVGRVGRVSRWVGRCEDGDAYGSREVVMGTLYGSVWAVWRVVCEAEKSY